MQIRRLFFKRILLPRQPLPLHCQLQLHCVADRRIPQPFQARLLLRAALPIRSNYLLGRSPCQALRPVSSVWEYRRLLRQLPALTPCLYQPLPRHPRPSA